MAGETRLILGDAINCTAAEEEAVADRMGIVSGQDLTAGLREGVQGRFLRQQKYHPARQEKAALVGPVRV